MVLNWGCSQNVHKMFTYEKVITMAILAKYLKKGDDGNSSYKERKFLFWPHDVLWNGIGYDGI